jgi:hypothetical protein
VGRGVSHRTDDRARSRLYYTGAGDLFGIGLLTSIDAEHWTPYPGNPVFKVQPGAWDDQIVEAAVIYHKGQYWMWYSGYRGALEKDTTIAIGLATSDDGVHWTRHPDNPVLRPGAQGRWNDMRVLAPDVLVDRDGSLLMGRLRNVARRHRKVGRFDRLVALALAHSRRHHRSSMRARRATTAA